MRLDFIRRGLLLAGLCSLLPLKEAGAGPAQDPAPVSRDPGTVLAVSKEDPKVLSKTPGKASDGKSVVGAVKKSAKPFYRPVSKSDTAPPHATGSKGGKPAVMSTSQGAPPSQPSQIVSPKVSSVGRPAGVHPVPPPRLEAFQPRQPDREQGVGKDPDVLKWTRFSTGRDDYFPVARVLGCNAPLVRQVTEMRLAMDVGFPRRPPKLPRIVLDLPSSKPVSQMPASEQRGVSGPDSEAAIEFFSEPATRTGVEIGIETVVLPIFRVAQPPPIPPVQSRANLRQE
jgi:hypothetical protein